MSFAASNSDNDTDSVHSSGSGGSLSGKQSMGSLRAVANGAIGSERQASKERSRDRTSVNGYTANSVSSDDGVSIGGGLVEIRVDEPKQAAPRRAMPKLVLTNAEKRKSSIFWMSMKDGRT
jgi:hypothetical protein